MTMKKAKLENMVHITNRAPLAGEGGVVQILGKALSPEDTWISPHEKVHQPSGIITSHTGFNFDVKTFDRPAEYYQGHYSHIALGLLWPFKHELTGEVNEIVKDMQVAHGGSKTRAVKDNLQVFDAHMRYCTEMVNQAQLDPFITVAHDFTCVGVKSAAGVNVFTDHTPFPNDTWIQKMLEEEPSLKNAGVMPYYLNSVCSYDLITMHTPEDCNNMLASMQRYAPDFHMVESSLALYHAFGNDVSVQCVPVGLNAENILEEADKAVFDPNIKSHLDRTIDRNVVLSAARNDYTKGTMEYADLIDNFFTENPDRLNDTTFLVYRSPSRQGLPSQQEYQADVKVKMDKLMGKYPQGVIYEENGIKHAQLMKLMQQPQIKVITSLPTTREGHDLTVREFVDVNPENSDKTVLLSKNVGAHVIFDSNAILVEDCRDPEITTRLNHALTNTEEARQNFNLMKAKSTHFSGANYLNEIKSISHQLIDYRSGRPFSFAG